MSKFLCKLAIKNFPYFQEIFKDEPEIYEEVKTRFEEEKKKYNESKNVNHTRE